jgi:hypothetical protein
MNIEEYLAGTFASAGICVLGVDVLSSVPESFGDFVADVLLNSGRIRVTKDRAQYFVDFVEDVSSGECQRGEIKWPQLTAIYGTGNWSLIDLLLVISDDTN